ncbi:MAG: alpha/beta hydrolase-fold protein, partial [Chitinophagaceae bacterium]
MFKLRQSQAVCERHIIVSAQLGRTVKIDLYLPPQIEKLGHVDLLFINDGQDLEKMNFNQVFQSVAISNSLVAVGLHAGPERRREYGVANRPDYLNRGDKAGAYHQFMLSEVFSFIDQILPGRTIGNRWLAGFS